MVKDIFSSKRNLVIALVGVLFIILFSIVFIVQSTKAKYALNKIYDVFPNDVRELYMNIVDVGCDGDLFLDIDLDDFELLVKDIDKNLLLSIIFSHIEKNDLLDNGKISKKKFNSVIEDLIIDGDEIGLYLDNDYNYGDSVYKFHSDYVSKDKDVNICDGDKRYISRLFGYSYSGEYLYVDVNIGYVKNNYVYDLSDNELGIYENDIDSSSLLDKSSYYTYKFVSQNNKYKLYSVMLRDRV